MSYTIDAAKTVNGCHGHAYSVTVNGLTVKGWRAGNRADVERHVSIAHQYSVHRAAGRVPKRNADGSFRISMRGKAKKQKPVQEVNE